MLRAENDKFVLKVEQDECGESPREWDNLGTMVCSHRRYNLGDEQVSNTENYNGWDELLKGEYGSEKDIIALPLYLYDHSGITMNTTGFSCPWDSGQVGWIYVDKEKVRKEFNVKRISKKLRQRVEQILVGEVNTYDQYLQGDVYGFTLEDKDGNHIDSCWGFYGTDWMTNGILDHVGKEHEDLVKNLEWV